jgi:hypothetical protein
MQGYIGCWSTVLRLHSAMVELVQISAADDFSIT